jgi:hypothetical protein
MFVCADCWAVCEGKEKHPESPACDEFDGQEDEVVVDTLPVTYDHIVSLQEAVINLSTRLLEQERKFNTIIAAIVKASGAEEER